MKLNRKDLKKIQYEFNSLSNRLLQSDFNDYNGVLDKYVRFLTNTEIIHDYIDDCGECDQDLDQAFQEVRSGRYIFALGDSTEEEVRNVYAILKYIVDNNIPVYQSIGMAYSHNTKYQEILKDFNNRVTMVLIRHIETHLTKVGIDMGLNENITYNITVKDGQVIVANDNATVNALNSLNAIDLVELARLTTMLREEALKSVLTDSEADALNSSLDVIEEELKSDKPRKSFIKTAITGIKAIKGTAEFGAAIAALIQFLQPFIG